MLVQIYAIKSIAEADLCIDSGVDRFGIVVGEKGNTPDEITTAQTRRIFNAIPVEFPRMVLTVETDPDAIVKVVRETEAEILHLSGDISRLPPNTVFELREKIAGVEIVQAIPVTGVESINLALAYADVCDVIFLDTKAPNVDVIGATGSTHDWSISREIIKLLSIPVILAGGLSPENVASAILEVRPWGVDSNTHTNYPGTWKKDPNRVRRFVQAAKSVL